jgi:DNA-binding NarL/FixJ family response regulator
MKKVLIVDDNSLFRKTLKECLSSQIPSLIILEAKDGEEALRAIPTFFPDLIFMDIMLPRRNGLELTDQIKRQYPDIKVVLLTSYDLPEYRDAALHSKADHYAPKDSFMPLVDLILSLSQSKVLETFLPICCECKKIRDKDGSWQRLEKYMGEHSNTTFSHGYCPECAKKALEKAGFTKR